MMTFVLITSCAQNDVIEDELEPSEETTSSADPVYTEMHSYGGWFCPDNLNGFPPVDISDLSKVPVVVGRLPTIEESRNGTSLMYFDKTAIPDARPLDVKLPQLARVYSSHSGMDEIVIVIQAVVAKNDTVVGFRYPNGGNGSAWYGQVTFLSEQEVNAIKPSPFVYKKTKINASKETIWQGFIRTDYAKSLGEKFNKEAFFNSAWSKDSEVHLNYESNGIKATGIVTTLWGVLYIQIDYDDNGSHYSEKMMVFENNQDNTSELHMVAGPYLESFETLNETWESWSLEVKDLSLKLK